MRTEKDEGLKIIKEETEKAKKKSDETSVSIGIDDMRLKRDEAHMVREKVGAHYRKYRRGAGDESDQDDKAVDDPVTTEAWLKDVNEDPYVREAINIIGDIIQLRSR